MKWTKFKPEFIIKVVEYSINNTVNKASKKYGVSIQNIYRWKRNPDNIKLLLKNIKVNSESAKKNHLSNNFDDLLNFVKKNIIETIK